MCKNQKSMEEYKLHQESSGPDQPQRNNLLTFLCIITFISSGLMAFMELMVTLNYSSIVQMIESGEISMPGIEIFKNMPFNYFLLGFIFYATSVLGAIFMWNLKKIGFHVYTASQLALIISAVIYRPGEGFPVLDLILTVLFVILYASNLRFMK